MCLALGLRACCKNEKHPSLPGTAKDMLLSSPRSLCQSCTDTLFRWSTAWRIEVRRSFRWDGKAMIITCVSRSQPRIVFWVDQKSSPFFSFLIEIGCFREPSSSSLGRRTVSMTWKVCRQTLSEFLQPWTALIKSSTYTSTYAKGGRR